MLEYIFRVVEIYLGWGRVEEKSKGDVVVFMFLSVVCGIVVVVLFGSLLERSNFRFILDV